MALVLHAGLLDKRNACKLLIAAEYCGVKVVLVNSVKQLSKLETPEGSVFDSNFNVVAKCKDGSTLHGSSVYLYGSSVYEHAQVEEWMEFADSEIDYSLRSWIYPMMGLAPCDPDHCVEKRIGALQHSLDVLNEHLATKNYLVGGCITLADIAMTCALHYGFTRVMTKEFTSEFPHVERYFWGLVNLPNFKKILGEVKQAEPVPPPKRPRAYEIFVDPEMIEAPKKLRETQKSEELGG